MLYGNSGTSEIVLGYFRMELSPSCDFENFATARRSYRQQNSSTVELVDHTCDVAADVRHT